MPNPTKAIQLTNDCECKMITPEETKVEGEEEGKKERVSSSPASHAARLQ